MKTPNWDTFLKHDLSPKEIKELKFFAENEIKEWQRFLDKLEECNEQEEIEKSLKEIYIQEVLEEFDEKFPEIYKKINKDDQHKYQYLLEKQNYEIKQFIKEKLNNL